MSYRIIRCKQGKCRAAIFPAVAEHRRRRLWLNDRSLTEEEVRANPDDVYYIADDGLAYPWSPALLLELPGSLYRAHRATCTAPPVREEPDELHPCEPLPVRRDPQMRLPVLPARPIVRRSVTAAGIPSIHGTHERGDHEHHRLVA